MADAPVLGAAKTSKVALDETAFGARFNGPLLHESVRAEQAARRRGTASTRTRGLISGGNSKPWRQKGTGRARAGSTRSPIFTGGGVVFGPHPRSYTFKINRKERRSALRSALSLHAQRGSLAILDAASLRRALDQGGGRAARGMGRAAPDAGRRHRARSGAPGSPSATSSASPCSCPRTSASPTSSAPRRCCARPRRSSS